MGNMSYCRFENTAGDLSDCEDNIEDMNLSETENRKRIELIETCIRIAEQFEDEDLDEYFKDNDEYGDDE